MKNNDNKKKNTAQNQADKKKKPTSKVVKTAVLGTVLGLFSCAVVGAFGCAVLCANKRKHARGVSASNGRNLSKGVLRFA